MASEITIATVRAPSGGHRIITTPVNVNAGDMVRCFLMEGKESDCEVIAILRTTEGSELHRFFRESTYGRICAITKIWRLDSDALPAEE